MRISKLHLQNVKRHADLRLDLAPGLNVIRGPNEAGKSTVQRALEIALFRRPTSTASELDGVRRWGVAADPQVSVTFEDEGVTRTLTKRFAGQKGTVELRTGNERLTDPAAVDQVISIATGLPSEKFFKATASVNHHDLAGLDQDANTLRDRLQQSMSGADKGTYAARRKLEDAIRRYRSEGAKNPGYLKVANANVERLAADVARGEAALAQLESERRELTELREKRVVLDGQQAELKRGVEISQRAVQLHRRGADAQARYNLYRRAAELQAELATLKTTHPSTIDLAVLAPAVERLRGVEYRLSEIRAELASEPDLSAYDVAIPAVRWRPWAIAGLLASVAAIGILFVGDAVGVGGVIIGVAAVLAAIGVMTAYIGVRQRRLMSDLRLQNELRDGEIRRRLRGRSQLVDDLRDVERERDEALTALDLPDLAAAEEVLRAETEHVSLIERNRAEYRGLFPDKAPAGDVVELRDKAAAEADECRHVLAGMGKIGEEPDKNLTAYTAALRNVTTERESAVRSEAQAEARVEANKIDAEQVALTVEALAAATEQLRLIERRLRIYETTLTALNEAEKATMKKAARFLEKNMASDVERITGGRYRDLRVDEENLAFSVFSPELGDWVDVRDLSQGTIDQFYLCARLGIVRQVAAPGSPPLIFDDPFVTFDDERARRAVDMLRDAAADHQVIFLTTSDRYDDLADNVITLAGPTATARPIVAATGIAATPVRTMRAIAGGGPQGTLEAPTLGLDAAPNPTQATPSASRAPVPPRAASAEVERH